MGSPAAAPCLGILAGGGALPREIADCVRARGHAVHIVALKGEADDDFAGLPVTFAGWGEIGRILDAFKSAGCRELVVVGRVKRPDLLRLRPDLGFLSNLPGLLRIVRAGGDDSVLRRVVGFIESHGLSIVGVPDVAPELLIGEGGLGAATPTETDRRDIAVGFDVVSTLGRYDIGQSVVVRGGMVEAVEGAEGTDAMLLRVAERRGPEVKGGVLVKRAKPGQELRVDLPAIGPGTVHHAAAAKLGGIAVEAHRVLAASRQALIAAAAERGIFIAGIVPSPTESAALRKPATTPAIAVIGRRRAGRRDEADIAKALAVIELAQRFGIGRAAVVTRRHVLAVESGEGVAAMLARAVALRQWGSRLRRGALVIADAGDLTASLVAATAAAGLAGLAVRTGGGALDVPSTVVSAANGAGIFLAVAGEAA